jgi:membrane protein YqaA with SNARE-associated domain
VLKRLYDWVIGLAGHRRALPALALVSFAESSVFPVPPDVLLLPMVLARPKRAWIVALVCTLASVAGGVAGYAIGALLFEAVGRPILDFYGYADKFQLFSEQYNEWGAWIVFGAGFTPIPYKVFTIASGVTGLDLVVFVIASTLSRGARFFLEATLLYFFGEPIRNFVEQRLALFATLFFVSLFAGFLLLKFVL